MKNFFTEVHCMKYRIRWEDKNFDDMGTLTKGLQKENGVYLHTLFLENEVQIDKNNYRTMLFMSKQVSLPKMCSILQKMKIGPKAICTLSAWRPSIVTSEPTYSIQWLLMWHSLVHPLHSKLYICNLQQPVSVCWKCCTPLLDAALLSCHL